MTLKEQIARHNTTMYRLAKDSGVPYPPSTTYVPVSPASRMPVPGQYTDLQRRLGQLLTSLLRRASGARPSAFSRATYATRSRSREIYSL